MTPPILGIFASAVTGGVSTTSFESIATVTVGSGGAANVEFTSIPGTYTHLQIRGIGKTNRATFSNDAMKMQFNSDTGSNYNSHQIYGDGTSAGANAFAWTAMYYSGNIGGSTLITNNRGAVVIDILDYANTNKYKTVRTLGGFDNNNNGTDKGIIALNSGLWRSTSAITSIQLDASEGTEFEQYTTFALYGIKSA
jgi:hypothetical protein